MSAFVISYDLNKERKNYDADRTAIVSRIESTFKVRWRPITTTWIVASTSTAMAVTEALADLFDENDRLFVFPLEGGSVWFGRFNDKETAWLENSL